MSLTIMNWEMLVIVTTNSQCQDKWTEGKIPWVLSRQHSLIGKLKILIYKDKEKTRKDQFHWFNFMTSLDWTNINKIWIHRKVISSIFVRSLIFELMLHGNNISIDVPKLFSVDGHHSLIHHPDMKTNICFFKNKLLKDYTIYFDQILPPNPADPLVII